MARSIMENLMVEKICRVCLSEEKIMFSLSDSDIRDIFSYCTSLRVCFKNIFIS